MQHPPIAPEPTQLYSGTARLLHWLTVVLLALQFPVGFYMAYRGNALNVWDSLTNTMYSGHKLSGLVILLIVVLRLLYRTTQGAPPDEPTLEPWQRLVGHLNHWLLYALLIAAPVAGYIGVALFPALDIFGLFKLPAVVSPDKEAAKTALLGSAHDAGTGAGVADRVARWGAALYHYLIRKDDVLGRMDSGDAAANRSRVGVGGL